MGFLKTLSSLIFGSVRTFSSAERQISKAKYTFDRLLSSEECVTPKEFQMMYDLRVYDLSSKQNDIKFMKKADFPGVYIFHNIDKDRYYIGKAGKVLYKIDRHFRGFENKAIFLDWKQENKFYIRAIRLSDSNYSNLDILYNEVYSAIATAKEMYN